MKATECNLTLTLHQEKPHFYVEQGDGFWEVFHWGQQEPWMVLHWLYEDPDDHEEYVCEQSYPCQSLEEALVKLHQLITKENQP